jgi:hypothetical protein
MRKVLTLVSLALLFTVAVVSARSLVLAHSKAKAAVLVQSPASNAAVENSETAADPAAVGANCPNIHKAVGALETALHDLETARHDFCGHKQKAMEDTRQALEQLRKAEACDQCR